MRNIIERMVSVQLAKNACKMKFSEADFEFLENIGVPVVINAMVEERAEEDMDLNSPLYDKINQIMEEANEQSK
jgi:hypothetical protein